MLLFVRVRVRVRVLMLMLVLVLVLVLTLVLVLVRIFYATCIPSTISNRMSGFLFIFGQVVVHLGAVPDDAKFVEHLNPVNIVGTYNVVEAIRYAILRTCCCCVRSNRTCACKPVSIFALYQKHDVAFSHGNATCTIRRTT